MLTQPENTIKFSDEQILAIEESKNRLSNLEAEISIANKNLKGIKSENEKTIKEKIYLEESVGSLKSEISTLQSEKEKLENTIKDGEANTNKILQEDRELKAEQAKKVSELTERENTVREGEANLAKQQEAVRKEVTELKAEKEKISKFKEALSEVLKTY